MSEDKLKFDFSHIGVKTSTERNGYARLAYPAETDSLCQVMKRIPLSTDKLKGKKWKHIIIENISIIEGDLFIRGAPFDVPDKLKKRLDFIARTQNSTSPVLNCLFIPTTGSVVVFPGALDNNGVVGISQIPMYWSNATQTFVDMEIPHLRAMFGAPPIYG